MAKKKAAPRTKAASKTTPASTLAQRRKAAPSSPKKPKAGKALQAFVRATKDFVSGETTAHIALPHETVRAEVGWYENNPPDGAGVVGAGTDQVKRTSLVGKAIGSLMLEAARRWPGSANVLQITCRAKGVVGKHKDEIVDLARAAWCEVLGQKAPDAGGVAELRSSKQAELLALLRQGKAGIKEWNTRRGNREKPNPAWDVTDFTGVDLSGGSYPGVSFFNLKFARGNLSGADLSRAELHRTDLTAANLAAANLTRADVWAAFCDRADFSRAKLAGAGLGFTTFRGAKFCDADLREVNLMAADLGGADLTGAQLDKAQLRGTRFNEKTLWPAGYTIPAEATWKGKGRDPREARG